jgi:hypothetical protein
MVKIRNTTELIQNSLDFYRTAKPQLDTKPATVARDLLVDGPSIQLAALYQELARIRANQSLRLSLGQDLDKLASNYGAVRRQGSASSGTSLFTFTEIEADIPINGGDVVTANNGATFSVQNGITVSPTQRNVFRATASKFRAQLDFAGISDEFAVEVTVTATAPGRLGNISRYALVTTSTLGVSNVTNAVAFGGGSDAEDDAAFRSRILAIFSGAQTGTALGYENTVRADSAVIDVLVVEPGNVLMTRDGTQVSTAEDGTKTIISEGTGGKVDIYVHGIRLSEVVDSEVYLDQSNKDDPTDPANDFVLGQIEGDENKTVTQKRIDNLESGILPDQPVNNIISVSGSSSGANFVEKATDSLGRVTGNYELIRDTGAFGGSPWGFDKLRWVSDRISDLPEDVTKGRFNGQDPLSFSDVLEISNVTQNISIVNENSQINASDRSSIQLAHWPVTNVTRVFNLTTGERYVVANQNPDGDTALNETGRIVISGSTLPAVSDVLQVDYTWVFNYDSSFDYDNRIVTTNPRSVTDSIDWGFSNAVRREESLVQVSGSVKSVAVTHPISSVISVNTFVSEVGTVTLVSGRLAVIVAAQVENVVSITRVLDGAEVYVSSDNDGSFSGFTIFLPTDTVAEFGDAVVVVYNANDVYTVDGVSGSFNENLITLSASSTITAGTIVECNYIANVRTLLPATQLSNLPALRDGNRFQTTVSSGIGTQPTTHVFSGVGVVESNLRQAPSRLQLSIAGSVSSGVITVTGTAFDRIAESVFAVGTESLTIELSPAIKSYLGLTSADSIPSNVEVIRLISVEKVTASDNDEVISVDHTYDVFGYKIRNNNFVKSEAVIDSLLTSTQITLPSTPDNETNLPSIGDHLRVTFYISTSSDSENVSFSKSGTLYTQKVYALVDAVAVSSGFTSGQSQLATLTVSNQNQPVAGSRYTGAYDYLAPKPNERITVTYNINSLIKDATLEVERNRPVSADVLVKAATPILIDVEMAVVVTQAYENSTSIVQQNVQDIITTSLNATALNTTIDSSDLIKDAYDVAGVDRVRIISFNKEDEAGSVLSISAQENEYLQANTVTVTIESR